LQFIDKTGTVYTAIGNGFPPTAFWLQLEEKEEQV
jgi:hypothetical protein